LPRITTVLPIGFVTCSCTSFSPSFTIASLSLCSTGGNQRELARQKHAKKQNEMGKGKRNEDGLSAAARKQRDAEIMQQKQKKANEKQDTKPK
uniref:Small EDRK-rich factor-like N-terminal domain-containing protein n=1 Tax=Denticeps clupeoides TaxID=299321 RepID=A0AAY4BNA1_9TELE